MFSIFSKIAYSFNRFVAFSFSWRYDIVSEPSKSKRGNKDNCFKKQIIHHFYLYYRFPTNFFLGFPRSNVVWLFHINLSASLFNSSFF